MSYLNPHIIQSYIHITYLLCTQSRVLLALVSNFAVKVKLRNMLHLCLCNQTPLTMTYYISWQNTGELTEALAILKRDMHIYVDLYQYNHVKTRGIKLEQALPLWQENKSNALEKVHVQKTGSTLHPVYLISLLVSLITGKRYTRINPTNTYTTSKWNWKIF